MTLEFNGKTCIKCHYKRQATDTGPEWACPSCGVAYNKAEAAAKEEQEQLSLQNRIERVEFMKENQKLDPKEKARIEADKLDAKKIYILVFLAGITGGVTFLVAMAMAHKHNNQFGKQNWVSSHFAWQVQSFWYASRWMGLGLAIMAISLVVAVMKGFEGGLGSGYEVYAQFFGWMFDPAFIKGLMVGGAIIILAGIWHLIRMIKGYRALQRGEIFKKPTCRQSIMQAWPYYSKPIE